MTLHIFNQLTTDKYLLSSLPRNAKFNWQFSRFCIFLLNARKVHFLDFQTSKRFCNKFNTLVIRKDIKFKQCRINNIWNIWIFQGVELDRICLAYSEKNSAWTKYLNKLSKAYLYFLCIEPVVIYPCRLIITALHFCRNTLSDAIYCTRR